MTPAPKTLQPETPVAARAASAPAPRVETVVQGSFRVSGERDLVLATVLGSCVAVCLHDPWAGLGGMNHFLLPEGRLGGSGGLRYGTHAMELLINALLRAGAERGRLRAKAFGGARMVPALRDIGGGNIAFARAFLARERIPLEAESLGGLRARRLRFWPATGRVRMMLLAPEDWQEPPAPRPAPQAGPIDLF